MKHHKETTWNGQKIIIDLAKIYDGYYEIMVLDETGEEIESTKTRDLLIAERIYKEYCEQYTAEELKGKYAKLRDDIRAAIAAGKRAIIDEDDDGTCNFDAPTLSLKGWNRKKVIQAAREAGTSADPWGLWGRIEYIISCPYGQANRRTVYAEAIRDSLKAAGYDAGMYYAMD